ncbi:MAG: BTAD domain-containing putative transcriptional regulator, partial [Gaiellales bacterium]
APGPSPAREPAPPSPETALSFGVLGPVQVWVEGRSPQIGAAKQRQLLAVLILRANQVVSADTLIDALWGERPPETATKAMQVYISQLRKLIEPEREERTAAQVLVSQPPGYRLVASPWSIDLHRFEQLWAEARTVGEGGDFEKSAEILREALGLWRGAPLADFAYEDYFAAEIARLTEMRLGALEDLIAAQLELGRHSDVVARLESLVLENPVREGLRGQLMLALYRCGRQADALAVYQEGRRVLLDELGIDPGPALQRLHRRILQHDPRLEAGPGRAGRSAALPERRSVLLATGADDDLDAMIALAGPLAHGEADRELILARLVPAGMGGDALAAASAVLGARCAELRAQGAHARTAAFTSGAPAADIVRLAQQQDVELLVMDGRAYLVGGEPGPSEQVLEQAPCDVALFVPAQPAELVHGVLVPFGGSEHDWAALELAAWISRSTGAPLRLAGTAAGTDHGRDASRLLADASLLLQRTAGITSEPLLIEPGATGIIDAASHAGLLVMGLGSGWRETGPGEVRSATARRAATPALFVRRGVRPGGLAPRETMTRFTWSLTGTTGSSR